MRLLAKWLIILKFKVEIIGLEYVPEKGPVILAANHVSRYDSIILGSIFKRNIHFMAKQELFRNRLSNWLFRNLYAIPVDRNQHMQIRPIRRSLYVIRNGEVFGIFPEGQRCRDGQKVQPKKGVAFLAYKSGAPVLPIALVGIRPGLRQPIKVVIGPLMDVKKIYIHDYAILSQIIMQQIIDMKSNHKEYEKELAPNHIV